MPFNFVGEGCFLRDMAKALAMPAVDDDDFL